MLRRLRGCRSPRGRRQRDRLPGPRADQLWTFIGDFDGAICGDDAFTREVLEKMLPRLKVLSKYGIGLDKIDLDACQDHKIPVLFTPGVNHTTVAEHAFCILLAGVRNLIPPAQQGVAFHEWFDFRPIPEITGGNSTDPKLLGIEEHIAPAD